MNKNIFTIGSIVLIGGALTAYLFSKIDTATFVGTSTTIIGIVYGLFQKWNKDEVVEEKLKLEDSLTVKDLTISTLNANLSLVKQVNAHLKDELGGSLSNNDITPEVVTKKTRKPKTK